MPGTILKTLVATGAQSDGTAVSSTLVPGFSATGFSIGASNTFTFQSAVATALGGTYGYRMNQASGTNQITTYIDLTTAVTGVLSWRKIYRYQNTPTTTTAVLRFFADNTHTPSLATINNTTTNRLQFVEVGTGALSVTSTGSALVPGNIYVEQGKIDLTANTVTINTYNLGSTSLFFSISGTLAADLAAATQLGSIRVGINTASSGIGNYDIDSNFAVGSGDFLARTDVSNVAPSANAGSDITVEAGASFTLTGSSSDSDGTVTGVEWKSGATSLGTSNALTRTAPVGLTQTTETFTFIATDDASATGSDTVVVTYLPASRRLKIGGVIVPVLTKAYGA